MTYRYDDLDRPTGMQAQALDAPIRMAYNGAGWRTTLSDGTGTTSFTYDALGRITGVTAPHTGQVRYSYTPRGERASLTSPDGRQLHYHYAPDGQLWQVAQGATVLASYAYDPAGRLAQLTRANGAVTAYAYDGAGRLRALDTQVDGQLVSQFTYDLATPTPAPPTSTPTATSTPSATPGPGATRVLYDDSFDGGWAERWSWGVTLDPAVAEPHFSGSVAYGVEYTSPWGALRLLPVAARNDWTGYGALRFAIHGGAAGGQTVKVRVNTAVAGFDLGVITPTAGQWQVVELPLPDDPALAEVREVIWQQHTGAVEPVFYLDRIELVADGATGGAPTPTSAGPSLQTHRRTIVYDYDGLSRLISATEHGSTANHSAYTYDRAGNRTSVTVNGSTTTFSYNVANQVVGWSYDAAGNLLNDGTTSFTYDALGRMTSRDGTSYRYNGDSVLVAQTTAGVTTRYVQDLTAPLSQVLSDGSATYLYGHARLGAQAGGTTTWYGTDALGSLRQTLDATGTPLTTASYDPWGTPQGSLIAPFGFTGELQDPSGVVYLRARWYTPGSGTFTVYRSRSDEASDSIPYSYHPYAYALSSPTNWGDPTGKYACDLKHTSSYSAVMNREYHNFCVVEKDRLDQELNISSSTSPIVDAPVSVLINVFTDPRLPGGTGQQAQVQRRNSLTPAAERLEFVLWYTKGEGRFAHNRVAFGDGDFAAPLRDSHLMTTTTGEPVRSNQVNHFLTAVELAYRYGWSGGWAMGCLIGHEQYGSSFSQVEQCVGVSWQSLQMFNKAMDADILGDYDTRDCYLRAIVPDLEEHPAQPLKPEDAGYGRSVQDLRLSLKGWIFGESIRTRQIATLEQARTWIRDNLAK